MDYISITGRSSSVIEFQRHIMEKFYALPTKCGKGNKEISCSKGAWDKSVATARRPELIKLIGIRNYTHPNIIANSPELNYFRYNSGTQFHLQEGWKDLLKEGLFLLIRRMGWDNLGTKKRPRMVEDEVFEEYLEWFVKDLEAEDWGHEPYMFSREERQEMLGKSSDEDGGGGTYISIGTLSDSPESSNTDQTDAAPVKQEVNLETSIKETCEDSEDDEDSPCVVNLTSKVKRRDVTEDM